MFVGCFGLEKSGCLCSSMLTRRGPWDGSRLLKLRRHWADLGDGHFLHLPAHRSGGAGVAEGTKYLRPTNAPPKKQTNGSMKRAHLFPLKGRPILP